MPTTQLGIVYYAKDPKKRVFRVVYPIIEDAELDRPPHDSTGIMRNADGGAHGWHSFGTKAEHQPMFEKIPAGDLGSYPRGNIVAIEADLQT